MKKRLICFLTIALCLSMAGCGEKGPRTAVLVDYGAGTYEMGPQVSAGYISGTWGGEIRPLQRIHDPSGSGYAAVRL